MEFVDKSPDISELDQDVRGVWIRWNTDSLYPRLDIVGGCSPWEAIGLVRTALMRLEEMAAEFVLFDDEELVDEEEEDEDGEEPD